MTQQKKVCQRGHRRQTGKWVRRVGADAVTKPFDPKALLEKIQELLK
ncbi:MAG: hypothetical protein KKD11_01745 [Candidatus Omnitrophica bacterium]|nr:hypothetical protein [Candidatus Omnitrophota bacterium]